MAQTNQETAGWLRRVGLIGSLGILAYASLLAQSRTGVHSKMSRYTDSDFGFSFWYPTAWKVTDEQVTDPTRDGWFPDAKIVKELHIRTSDGTDNDPAGVILQELVAPAGLTELGRSRSPSPVGIDERYFFDNATHRWMDAQLSELPDGASPETVPLKIEQKTMGGLPMWFGAVRGGAELIVPLDATHFLAVITTDPGGENSHTYLAKTLVGTHPDSGARASERVQQETIRQEAVKLGAIGKLFGGCWYKDSEYVYNFDGEVLPGADPKTFVLLPYPGSFPRDDESFATDGVHVYRAYSGLISGADPKTFVVTGPSVARDAHHTYDWSSGILKVSSMPERN
jgi:hypothetical protein